MAFIPIPNSVKVSVEWLVAGQEVVLTFTVRKPSAVTQTDVNNIRDVMHNWASNNLRNLMHSGAQYQRTYVVDLSSENGPFAEAVPPAAVFGSIGGVAAANNVALAVSHRTAQRGKSFRGRVYLGGLAAGSLQTATTISPTFVTTIAGVWALLVGALTAQAYQLAVPSRQANKQPRVTGLSTPVSLVLIDAFLDSQRRRLAGRGE